MKKQSILFVGGFDNTCGAGVMADFRVATFLRINPFIAITSFAVQNNIRGFQNFPVSLEMLELNFESAFEEANIQFVKVGMIGSPEIALFLKQYLNNKKVKIILDTPLKTSSKSVLQLHECIKILGPSCFLITPNSEEFLELGGKEYFQSLNVNFLVKSAIKNDNEVIDELFMWEGGTYKKISFSLPRLNLKYTVRGTGCSLASAICCFLFEGLDLEKAIEKAKNLIFKGIKNSSLQGKVRFLSFEEKPII